MPVVGPERGGRKPLGVVERTVDVIRVAIAYGDGFRNLVAPNLQPFVAPECRHDAGFCGVEDAVAACDLEARESFPENESPLGA